MQAELYRDPGVLSLKTLTPTNIRGSEPTLEAIATTLFDVGVAEIYASTQVVRLANLVNLFDGVWRVCATPELRIILLYLLDLLKLSHLQVKRNLQYAFLWSSSSCRSVNISRQFPQISISGLPTTRKRNM